MKKIAVFMVCAAILWLCACSGSQSPETGSIVLTDMSGRSVTLTKPAERVVVIAAGDCEIIAALGAADTLVGRGTYCDWPESILDVPSVQSGDGLSTEQIVALEPDVIIMSMMAQTAEQVEALERAGLTVIETAAKNIEGTFEAIRLIGAALGKVEAAEDLVTYMEIGFNILSEEAKKHDLSGTTVYFEVSPLEYGPWAAGRGTFMDEIAAMLGLENIFSDVESWAQVSQEQVLERDPDYIITSAMYFGDGLLPVDEILSREAWKDMKALVSGKVYAAKEDEITRPGPRLVDAVVTLYGIVFEDEISLGEVVSGEKIIFFDNGVIASRKGS